MGTDAFDVVSKIGEHYSLIIRPEMERRIGGDIDLILSDTTNTYKDTQKSSNCYAQIAIGSRDSKEMSINRFCVMALLQAARGFELGLPLESALSWGLNRSIFYAAAKRGFKGHGAGMGGSAGQTRQKKPDAYYLGDEMAYKDERNGKLCFAIGGKVQTKEDFQKQIESRFRGKFDKAWDEALDYVRHFPRETLLSANGFFADVYRPKRDEFAEKWSEMSQE